MWIRISRPAGAILLAAAVLIPLDSDVCSAQKRRPGDLPSRILVLDGSPVHDVGLLHSHASNWGMIGSMPGTGLTFSHAPSAEWPADSRVEYLFGAGVWVGGLISGVPAVSTSFFTFEFRPSSDVRDIVYHTAFGAMHGNRIPSADADDDHDGFVDEDPLDGFDNDLDGLVDEDFAAISDQMLSRRFRDDDPSAISIYPDHVPMHLQVYEESYQFSNPAYDDFVGFTLRITNDGIDTIDDVYIGVFADGDVGHRDTPNYWGDDATSFASNLHVDHSPNGSQDYDFAYWYDVDGDGGQAPGYCGIVLLGNQAVTYANFAGNVSYQDGGDPTNDFERYELMSSETIERDATIPRDHRTLVAVGPFAELAPGETIEFSFALVVTPRNDFTNVVAAAKAYHGLWFDLDGDPATGVNGKEHQEHWYLPMEDPVPVTFTRFEANALDTRAVRLTWDVASDEDMASFELLRSAGEGDPQRIAAALPARTSVYVDEAVTAGVSYQYQLIAHTTSGASFASPRVAVVVPTATLSLRQNAPNPFRESTIIGVTLDEPAAVDLGVYDVSGRRVATVATGSLPAGDLDLMWDGTNDRGEKVGAGIYFYRLQVGGKTLTRKLIVMR